MEKSAEHTSYKHSILYSYLERNSQSLVRTIGLFRLLLIGYVITPEGIFDNYLAPIPNQTRTIIMNATADSSPKLISSPSTSRSDPLREASPVAAKPTVNPQICPTPSTDFTNERRGCPTPTARVALPAPTKIASPSPSPTLRR